MTRIQKMPAVKGLKKKSRGLLDILVNWTCPRFCLPRIYSTVENLLDAKNAGRLNWTF